VSQLRRALGQESKGEEHVLQFLSFYQVRDGFDVPWIASGVV